jgi:hypothetical protein
MSKFIGAGGGVQIPCDDASARVLGYEGVSQWLLINDKYGAYANALGLNKKPLENISSKKTELSNQEKAKPILFKKGGKKK